MTPPLPGPVVRLLLDPVHDRVPHGDIGRGHVDLGPQDTGSFAELPGPHPFEQSQIFFHGPVPIGALPARLGQGAPVVADLVRTQIADIGLTQPDQLESVLVEPVIVVGSVVQAILPVEAQPAHIADDRLHILHALPARVRVVHPKIAGAPVLGGDPEIEADGFGVSDMGISVRFGRKAGGHPALMFVGSEVFFDDVPDKIGRGRSIGVVHVSHFLSAPFPGRLPLKVTSSERYGPFCRRQRCNPSRSSLPHFPAELRRFFVLCCRVGTTYLTAGGAVGIVMFVDKVPESQDRMPVDHLRTGKPHHPSDLLLHLGLVTVYRALAACRLLFPERAFLRPLFGIDRERPALFTESLSASVMAAAIDADHLPYRLYLPLRTLHALPSSLPSSATKMLSRRGITRIPFPCNSR